MADVASDAGCASDIVKAELLHQGVELQQHCSVSGPRRRALHGRFHTRMPLINVAVAWLARRGARPSQAAGQETTAVELLDLGHIPAFQRPV